MVPETLPVFRLFPYRELSQSLIQSTPSSRVQPLSPIKPSYLLICHRAWPPKRAEGPPPLSSFRESRECQPWGFTLRGLPLGA